ncbi:MAG: helix-turn-helix domain-containing protein [Akkermansiaceae bacterium]|nr:helix-turn-helix domain-containing protein [Akkermansiaceae bacterium]
MGASLGINGKVFCHHLSPIINDLWHLQVPTGTQVDTAPAGMDTLPSSPRTELDLITEQELASHLKICRRQLYNWRVGGLVPYFKMGKAVRFRVADVAAAIERMRV